MKSIIKNNIDDLPDSIEYYNPKDPNIRVKMLNNGSVIFESPPQYKGKKFKSILNATLFIYPTALNVFKFWKTKDKYWTVFNYEREIYGKNTPKSTLVRTESLSNELKQEYKHVDDYLTKLMNKVDHKTDDSFNIFEVGLDLWDSKLISKWINRPNRNNKGNIMLNDVTHFRRYGQGMQFEFLCEWKVKDDGEKNPKTWVKYSDMIKVNAYYQFLKNGGWDMIKEKDNHWEEKEDTDNNFFLPENIHYIDQNTDINEESETKDLEKNTNESDFDEDDSKTIVNFTEESNNESLNDISDEEELEDKSEIEFNPENDSNENSDNDSDDNIETSESDEEIMTYKKHKQKSMSYLKRKPRLRQLYKEDILNKSSISPTPFYIVKKFPKKK